jgi:LacI family transcriptional regulator, kdg operon repressor
MQTKSVTIDEVSKKANVSKTTISRYINGKFEYMSEETRERIRLVIEELEYRPNTIARNLKSKKSSLIGVIVADISSPFSSILLKGIIDYCTQKGFQTMVASTNEDYLKEREYILSMIDRQVEGIIINTAGNNLEFLENLQLKGVTIALADRVLEKNIFDTVTSDNEKMTYKVIESLYEKGFERVGFFSETLGLNSTRLIRHKCFLQKSEQYVENSEHLVYIIGDEEGKNNYTSYEKALLSFTSSNEKTKNAILAVNGVAMLNIIHAAKKLNISIPNNIGLCGYDDWGWTSLIGTGISVVSQPSYEIGFKSAELIIKRIDKGINYKSPIYLELSSQLIIRGSTSLT